MARERVERGADTSPASSQPSLSIAEIRQLITLMNGSDIEEIAIEREADGLKLNVVREGQVVAAIEALNVLNDVEASGSGRVHEILASDGQPVEYGQPLLVIEPLRT
jgi:multidrug efflux pump subunit AcrA (membrane-fusion protein)